MTATEATKHLESAAVESSFLDDLVYNCKSEEANDINNAGKESQLRYLRDEGMTDEQIVARMFD